MADGDLDGRLARRRSAIREPGLALAAGLRGEGRDGRVLPETEPHSKELRR